MEKALNKIGREDIVNKCIFNVELVTDDVEKAVARVRLDQPGFDSLKEELGPSRNTSLRRDATMDPKMDPDYEEPDRMKVCSFFLCEFTQFHRVSRISIMESTCGRYSCTEKKTVLNQATIYLYTSRSNDCVNLNIFN